MNLSEIRKCLNNYLTESFTEIIINTLNMCNLSNNNKIVEVLRYYLHDNLIEIIFPDLIKNSKNDNA